MNNPKCPYFPLCGGCLYLDTPFQDYIQKKKNFIINSFSHTGIDISLNDFVSVPFGSRRRATFAFAKGIVGFNEAKSHKIIPLDSCLALTKKLSDLLPRLKMLSLELKKRGDISLLDTKDGIDIHIKTGKDAPTLNERMLLAEFAYHPDIVRLSYNFEPIVEKIKLPHPIDMFLQPSVEGEKALVNMVLSMLCDEKNVVDLFCGAGTFTKPLIEKGFKTIGYDSAKESVALLKENGIKRDLFRNPLLASELANFDAVVMDPPRAGAKEQTIELSKTNIKKIIMISCNPVTAARDSRILIDNGWKISKIIGVDQFVYTNHVEIVCLFEK